MQLKAARTIDINELLNSDIAFPCGGSIEEGINSSLMYLLETGQCEKIGGLPAFKEGLQEYYSNRMGNCYLTMTEEDDPIVRFNVCPASFELQVRGTGNGTAWATQITNVRKLFWYSTTGFKYMQIPILCIHVSTDNMEAWTMEDMATLLDETFLIIFDLLRLGLISEEQLTAEYFASAYEIKLEEHFTWGDVSANECADTSIFSNPLETNVLGICTN